MDILNVISRSEIVANRDQWLQSQTTAKAEIARLTAELKQLEQRVLALDGAIQACNVFINTMDNNSASSETITE